MPKMSSSDKLARYRNRLEHAARWREEQGYDATWRRMIDLYAGRHFPASMSDEDRIAINVSFSTVNVIEPSVAINHPKVVLTANKEEDDDKAMIAEAAVNYWWRHYKFKDPLRAAVKDSIICGHGWLKVGWRYVEKDKALDPDEQAAQAMDLKAQADSFAATNPDLAHSLPTDEEIEANVPETNTVVMEDRPYVERVSPFDMYVDPEATCTTDAKWIAQRTVRTLEDVRKDKRYRPGVRKSVKGDTTINSEYLHPEERKRRGSDIDRVTVWEYYDLVNGSLCVFAEGSDDYLIDPQAMPYSFGSPYEYVPNYLVPDEFYGMGDLEQLECIQQELNKTRSQMMNHRKKYSRKYMARTAALSPEGRENLASDEDNVIVEIIDDNQPFSEIIAPVPLSPMSADLYQYSDIMLADIDRISGVNEYARGAIPETRRTATEASIISDAANSRAEDKLGKVESVVSNVARKVVQLAQQYLTGEQVARVVGQDGAKLWVPFDNEDIQGEFDFEVEAGSTAPINEQQRRQTAVQMLQVLGPLMGQVLDPAAIAQYVLRDGFGIKNTQRFMMPPPDPNAHPDPHIKIDEVINYKDAPPDVQRQMEYLAGLVPSDPMHAPPSDGGPQGGQGASAPTDAANMPPGDAAPPGPPQPQGAPPPDAGMQMPGAPGALAPQMDPQMLLQLQQQAAQGAA